MSRAKPLGELLRSFRRTPKGAPASAIDEAARTLEIEFPRDYVQFMRQANGGEGPVGEHGHLQLWRIEDLVDRNAGYRADEFFPGHVLIGSNGGGEAVALRRSASGVELVLVPFVGDIEDALVGGATFEEFLTRFGSGAIWKARR
jgi:hypothetical protein